LLGYGPVAASIVTSRARREDPLMVEGESTHRCALDGSAASGFLPAERRCLALGVIQTLLQLSHRLIDRFPAALAPPARHRSLATGDEIGL
jgi:hypothetical protein